MADDDVVRWKVTGALGEGVNWGDASLGDEVLVVARCIVHRQTDTLEDGDTVATFTLKVTQATKAGDRSTLADAVRKALAREHGTLPL